MLVTGAAGLVGQTVAAGLAAEGHAVRAHDIRPLAEVNAELAAAMAEVQQGDLADMEGALEAVRGVDAVVHLGGSPGVQGEEDPAYSHVPPNSASWATILHSNIEGTRNIYEAAAQSGVSRVVYASRAGLLSPYPWTLFRSIELPLRPVGNYSCSKAMGEAMAFSYASSNPMSFVVCRIGNYRPCAPPTAAQPFSPLPEAPRALLVVATLAAGPSREGVSQGARRGADASTPARPPRLPPALLQGRHPPTPRRVRGGAAGAGSVRCGLRGERLRELAAVRPGARAEGARLLARGERKPSSLLVSWSCQHPSLLLLLARFLCTSV